MNNTDYLQHYGILGMRWGIRRYQNKDGSLTPAGKKRLSKLDAERETLLGKNKKSESTEKPKSVKEMTTDELQSLITRRRMEKEYLTLDNDVSNLTPVHTPAIKRFLSTLGGKVIAPAAMDAGKKFLTDFLNKEGSKLLGMDKTEDVAGAIKKLRQEAEIASLKEKKIRAENFLRDDAKSKTAQKTKTSTNTETNSQASTDTNNSSTEKGTSAAPKTSKETKSTNNSQKTSQNKSTKTDTAETVTGEVFGEGTSHKTFTENEAKRRDSGPIYTYDFTDKTTRDPEVRSVINIGQSYIAGLLEERKK